MGEVFDESDAFTGYSNRLRAYLRHSRYERGVTCSSSVAETGERTEENFLISFVQPLSSHDSLDKLFKLIRHLAETMAKTTKPGFYAGKSSPSRTLSSLSITLSGSRSAFPCPSSQGRSYSWSVQELGRLQGPSRRVPG